MKLTHLLDESTGLPALDSESRSGALSIKAVEDLIQQATQDHKLFRDKTDLLKAALLLWNDHLHEAHTLAQAIPSPDGSFLHAVMHRREPDYFNSKYWWRRVGTHPSFEALARRAREYVSSGDYKELERTLVPTGKWDPFAYVDACEEALRTRNAKQIETLQQLQKLEIESFLESL